MAESLHILLGTSACLQWLCHSGERTVARGPLVANSVDPDQTAPHCLPVCKNRFEKFARIFNRGHKQTTFSDADFLGILRVK